MAELKLINWTWDTEAKLQQGQVDIGVNFSILDTSIKVRNEPYAKQNTGCAAWPIQNLPKQK
ncbi:hypothetical protein JCM19241_973 [Vibrio ishigakensis]|uniref:Uncharacterized protein n=1 Tax=Vibrio ishigakensis TaxID=1481914 RepID=A0A0B8Q4T7_9VIBR|nr:hypothetical protein JCM19241_973 [Vibrio ishigakensis]